MKGIQFEQKKCSCVVRTPSISVAEFSRNRKIHCLRSRLCGISDFQLIYSFKTAYNIHTCVILCLLIHQTWTHVLTQISIIYWSEKTKEADQSKHIWLETRRISKPQAYTRQWQVAGARVATIQNTYSFMTIRTIVQSHHVNLLWKYHLLSITIQPIGRMCALALKWMNHRRPISTPYIYSSRFCRDYSSRRRQRRTSARPMDHYSL